MDATSVQQQSQSQTPTPPTKRSWMQGPLPEIFGYVGAALVASAGLNFIAQSWEQWTFVVRVSLISVAAVLLYAAALTILGLAGWRSGLNEPDHANRRRLVAVLLAFAAVLVGALAAVVLDEQGLLDYDVGNAWILVPGALAFTGAALGAWLAPGVVSTLAVAGTSAWFGISFLVTIAGEGSEWWYPIVASAFGALWLAAAPRILQAPQLSEALGMAWLFMFLGPPALADPNDQLAGITDSQAASIWVSRGLLILLAVVALTLFARGATWPWAVGGVIAATMAATAIAGQALGWVAALLVAGVVLLVLSGLLLAVRRRSEAKEGASHTVGSGNPA